MLGVCVRECVRARTEDEQALYLLFESSSGYGLFERVESEEIGAELDEVQKSIVECAPSLPRSLAPSLLAAWISCWVCAFVHIYVRVRAGIPSSPRS